MMPRKKKKPIELDVRERELSDLLFRNRMDDHVRELIDTVAEFARSAPMTTTGEWIQVCLAAMTSWGGLMRLGRYSEAADLLHHILNKPGAKASGDFEMHAFEGIALLYAGRFAGAFSVWKRLKESDSKRWKYHAILIRAQLAEFLDATPDGSPLALLRDFAGEELLPHAVDPASTCGELAASLRAVNEEIRQQAMRQRERNLRYREAKAKRLEEGK